MRLLKYLVWILPFALPLYLVRFHVGPLPTTLLEVYLGILAVCFIMFRRWSGWREGWKRLDTWRWPILVWVIIGLISALVAPNLISGLGLWRAYILEPILVLIILVEVLRTAEDRRLLERSLFGVTIILFFWALIQFVTGYGIPHPWDVAIGAGRRATGPFPYPNALALFVTPIGAYAFVKWLSGTWYRKVPGTSHPVPGTLLAWIFSLGSILLAKSDGGLIAFLIVAAIALLINRRTRWWTVGGVVLIIIVTMLSPVGGKIWKELTFQGWSGQVRLFQWRETRQMLHDHWLFGAGLGGYPTVFAPYHKATAIEIFQYPHNILLNFWTEMGLLGVLAFVWIVMKWALASRPRTGYWLPVTGYLAIAPLLAILIHGLVDVPYFKNDLAILSWMLLFISLFSLETKKAHP